MRQRHTNASETIERENKPSTQENEYSYSAIQISRPGGYDELKKVSLSGKGALGANMAVSYTHLTLPTNREV